MRNTLTIFLLSLLAGLGLAAQDFTDSFFVKVKASCTSVDYSYAVNAETKITGNGKVRIQDNAFYMSGNGLEVWCDGEIRQTVDKEGKEIVIETVEDYNQYSANPALLLTNLDKVFETTKTATENFLGKKAQAVYLKPQVDCDIAVVRLFFVSETLSGASLIMPDGTQTDLVFTNWKFEKKTESPEAFRFKHSTLDGYVITDLR